MSAAFVVQTGFKVSRILADIADAPIEVQKLRDIVDENTLLANAYLNYLKTRGSSKKPTAGDFDCRENKVQSKSIPRQKQDVCTASLSAAVSALLRELQHLETVCSTYSRGKARLRDLKFAVGSKAGVEKSLKSLERIKTTLISGLTLANSELSTSNPSKMEDVLAIPNSQWSHKMDDLQRTLVSQMEDQRKVLEATMKQYIESLHKPKKTKTGANCRTSQATLTAKQLAAQLVLVRKALRATSETFRQRHQKTQFQDTKVLSDIRDQVSTGFAQLHRAMPWKSTQPRSGAYLIQFQGQRRDMVLAHLLPLRRELDLAVENILAEKPNSLEPHFVIQLRSQFAHLVASAAQEEAAQHPFSTASSFDEWTYNAKPNESPKKSHNPNHEDIIQETDSDSMMRLIPSPAPQSHPRWTSVIANTDSGIIRISRMAFDNEADKLADSTKARLTFTPKSHVLASILDIHFTRLSFHDHQPIKMHAQLNAFDIVELSEYDQLYRSIFQDRPIRDIDDALRTGKISPYHVSLCGINLCIYYIVRFGRLELLQYLDDNGIGLSNLDGDYSALLGFTRGLSLTYLGTSGVGIENYKQVLDYMSERTYLPPAVFSGMWLMAAEPETRNSSLDSHTQAQSLLSKWTRFLKEQDLDIEQQDVSGRTPLLSALLQIGYPSALFIQLLLEFGANVDATDDHGRNAVQLAMYSKSLLSTTSKCSWSEMTEEKLCLLIEAGADIHHRDKNGFTPSHDAKRYDCWDEWCRALERNGRSVEDTQYSWSSD